MKYTSPEPLNSGHDVKEFDCGFEHLNDWLKRTAFKAERNDSARTYVVSFDGKVVGYYCIATGSAARDDVITKMRQNMPDPVPVIVLGRLAVDTRHQGQGIGQGLVKDAALRTLNASQHIGIKGLLLHVRDENAKNFYMKKCGFYESPIQETTLMLPISCIRKNL